MSAAQAFRLGTRGSQLALCQARMVSGRLAEAGATRCEVVVIRTSGDKLQDRPLSEAGGKNLFVKELEDALLNGEIDLAVHSSKDLPAVLPGGLTIAGVLPREDPRDAVVLPARFTHGSIATLDALVVALGPTPSIGTGSIRRVAQLTRVFRGATFAPIRGNLDTRLKKLDSGDHDALVLAVAGLRRLGLGERVTLALPPTTCLPAPGQGIVAIETRMDDADLRAAIAAISDPGAGSALEAERAMVAELGGGCQTPIGALATPVDEEALELAAIVVAVDGSRMVGTVVRGPRAQAAALGERAARQLVADGAGDILMEASRRHGAGAGPRS